jgi:hypothetical protein
MKEEIFRDDIITVDGKELYPIPGFPLYYANLDEGKIFSTKSEKYLVSNPNKRYGYCYVSLTDENGKRRPMGIHTAILSASLGIHRDILFANDITTHHIDNEKTNNAAWNLQPIRHKDQFKCEITRSKMGTHRRLSQFEVDAIKDAWFSCDCKKSDFCNEWSEKLGVTYSTIEYHIKKIEKFI